MVRRVLSPACLVGTKATWSLLINLGMNWESIVKYFSKTYSPNLIELWACNYLGWRGSLPGLGMNLCIF